MDAHWNVVGKSRVVEQGNAVEQDDLEKIWPYWDPPGLKPGSISRPSDVSRHTMDRNDEKLEEGTEVAVSILPQSTFSIFNKRNIPPFVPSQDIVRGVVYVGQAALGYAFMLAIMCVSMLVTNRNRSPSLMTSCTFLAACS